LSDGTAPGGAIHTGTDNYVNYLLPGILLIAIASGIAYTSYRLFMDMQRGIFERFHSMPIARSAPLWGHVLTSLVSNAISVLVIILVALMMGFRSSAGVLSWLAVAGILVLFTLGIGLLLAAESVDRPDLLLAAPVALRVWMYLSPIAYPVSLVPERYRELYLLNPFAVIIEGLRSSFAGLPYPSRESLLYVSMLTVLLFLLGLWRFRRTEQRMIDYL